MQYLIFSLLLFLCSLKWFLVNSMRVKLSMKFTDFNWDHLTNKVLGSATAKQVELFVKRNKKGGDISDIFYFLFFWLKELSVYEQYWILFSSSLAYDCFPIIQFLISHSFKSSIKCAFVFLSFKINNRWIEGCYILWWL